MNLLGIFDVSDTVAVQVDYNLYMLKQENKPSILKMHYGVLTAIIVSSVFGLTVVIFGVVFGCRSYQKKSRLVRLENEEKMQQEIQLESQHVEQRKLPKISDRLVSSGALQKFEK